MKLTRRALAIVFPLMAVFASKGILAQTFPSKPVHLLVPFSAGGSVDVLARALANELSKTWGQPVVVENPVGAASIIGAQKTAASAPDGYTLFFTLDGTVVANRFLYKKLPYDPDKSLTPLSMVGRSPLFLIVPASSPVNTMRELIDAARRAPGTVSYSSGGPGTPGHLLFELIGSREGVQFLHVPYKGVAPAMTATISGEVQLSAASPGQSGPTLKGGRLKALAITAQERSKQFPEIPTVAEAGYPFAGYTFWWGLFAPPGMDLQLAARISRDAAAIIKNPEFSAKYLVGVGIDPVASTPVEFTTAIRADVDKYAEMIKAAKIVPVD